MIGRRLQPTPAIIKVRNSDELQDQEFTNILTFIETVPGSQGKFRLLIMVGVFHGWDGELCGTQGYSTHFFPDKVQIKLVRPGRRRGPNTAACAAHWLLFDKDSGAM